MKKHDNKSSSLREELLPLVGRDATLARMLKTNRPLTLGTYLRMEYPQGIPEVTQEVLASVPAPLLPEAQTAQAEAPAIRAEQIRRSMVRQL